MLIDVFMFNDEFDMLDCRVYQMRGLVDQFVVIEANQTVSGIPKPYLLSERMSRYPDVPLHVVQVRLDDIQGDWERDRHQRAGASAYLASFPDDALVIYGDLDEIIRRDVVERCVSGGLDGPVSVEMRHLVYSVHWQHPDPWHGGVIAPRSTVGNMTEVRYGRSAAWPRITDGGWHLSWFGSPEDRSRKMRHFAHQEMVGPIGDKVATVFPGWHMHVDGHTPLIPHAGDVPDWVADGHAPSSWYKSWEIT